MPEQGRELPACVRREFEDFLRCGRLEHGFLQLRCERSELESSQGQAYFDRHEHNQVHGSEPRR